ncbi:MAG: hypothetical protein NC452_05965 [Eubacterium sp.]|nr:hypothetical protein [Eubacterium sp.]
MDTQCHTLLQKANAVKDEIAKLENHIEAGKQFQGEDMYEILMGTTEAILKKKQQELSAIISQLEEMKTKNM